MLQEHHIKCSSFFYTPVSLSLDVSNLISGYCDWSGSMYVSAAQKSDQCPLEHLVSCSATLMILRCMVAPPSFFAIFSKGDHAIFVTSCLLTWRTKSSRNGISYSQRKEFALMGANSFSYEMTPTYMGGKNENDRVAPLKVYPFNLILGLRFLH